MEGKARITTYNVLATIATICGVVLGFFMEQYIGSVGCWVIAVYMKLCAIELKLGD